MKLLGVKPNERKLTLVLTKIKLILFFNLLMSMFLIKYIFSKSTSVNLKMGAEMFTQCMQNSVWEHFPKLKKSYRQIWRKLTQDKDNCVNSWCINRQQPAGWSTAVTQFAFRITRVLVSLSVCVCVCPVGILKFPPITADPWIVQLAASPHVLTLSS